MNRPGQEERMIDVRGPRFGAATTTVVLGLALLIQGPVGIGLVVLQTVQFVAGSTLGPSRAPWGRLFQLVRERGGLGPPPEMEPEEPPRFAQRMGLSFTVLALVAFAAGVGLVGWILVGAVMAVAALLALTGLCVGCELYLLGQRLRARGTGQAS